MTRVVISQPMYFPWVGFMAQMALADVYIWLDDAQYSKGSFTNRVQVINGGVSQWMSIPLQGKGTYQRISDLLPANDTWSISHRGLLRQCLGSHPHRAEAFSLYDNVIKPNRSLCEILIASAEAQARYFGILPPRIYRSSEMDCRGSSWERVLQMTKAVNGTDYLTGHGALAYLDHEAFNAAHISVSYMAYDPLPWPQSGNTFTPYVTALDLIASIPQDAATNHLRPASIDWRAFKNLKAQQQ
jgi:hypothetical protein